MGQSEQLELEWVEVQRGLVPLLKPGEWDRALAELEVFLSRDLPPRVLQEVLAFRAHLREELGDLQAAKEDLLAAHALCKPGYSQYVNELVLGSLCEKLTLPDEALAWYRSALKTCLQVSDVSGGSALASYLRLRGQDNLDEDEKNLCARAVQRSWTVLGIEGEPDFRSLSNLAHVLIEAQGRPPKHKPAEDD